MDLTEMSFSEIYDCFEGDHYKIKIKIGQLYKKVVKKFKLVSSFPVCRIYDYTVPQSGIKYVLGFYADGKIDVEHPRCCCFALCKGEKGHMYFIRWGMSKYRHFQTSEYRNTKRLEVYTPHFFKRYNERILHSSLQDRREIACYYFTRNPIIYQVDLNEEVKSDYEKYGATCCMAVHEGICFIQHLVQETYEEKSKSIIAEALCFIYKTFISESILSSKQKDEISVQNIKTTVQFLPMMIGDGLFNKL